VRAIAGALLSLVLVVLLLVALAFAAAFLYHLRGGSWQHAIVVVFLVFGVGLVGFALITHGAEQSAGGLHGGDIMLERVFSVPPDERVRLNATGVLVIAGVVIAAIAIVIDAL
jgi:hypothetical protein